MSRAAMLPNGPTWQARGRLRPGVVYHGRIDRLCVSATWGPDAKYVLNFGPHVSLPAPDRWIISVSFSKP